jgi:hypothetical protein
MSKDVYRLDRHHHGGAHIDRYNRQGQLIGRYRLDESPIQNKGRLPPPVPAADRERFRAEADKAE